MAWPGLLVYQNKAKLLYDGAELNLPTLHGVVVRRSYASAPPPHAPRPSCRPNWDCNRLPRRRGDSEAKRVVAQSSGLPQEVVYLYNGPGGTSFDATLKPSLIDALKSDVPYLKSIGDFADLDVTRFVQDNPLRTVFAARGRDYAAAPNADARDPSALRGDPALASELWLDGCNSAQTVANPTSLLHAIRDASARGTKVRAAYVPDAELGTRWFADKAFWVQTARPTSVRHPRRRGPVHIRTPGQHRDHYQQALGGSV